MDNPDGHLMMKKLLRSLVNLKILTETHSDLALRQYISFTKEDAKLNASLVNEVSRSNDCLDDFYFKKMKISKFKELALLCKIVFTLSHSQSSVARGFSLNKSVLADNISNQSIVYRRIIKDHMLSNEVKPHTFQIISKLMLNVKSSRMQYQAQLDKAKEEKDKEHVKQQKDILQEEINDLQNKKTKNMSNSRKTSYKKR